MRQYALKRYGKFIPGGVYANKSGCWMHAAKTQWENPSRCIDSHVVRQLTTLEYSVVRVQITEVKEKHEQDQDRRD